MEPYLVKIFSAAGITSAAAICAAAINGFRNAPAGSFACAGGIVPWLIIGTLFLFHPGSRLPAPALLGLFSIGPLFILALVFYSSEESSMSRNLSLAASGVGAGAGICFAVILGYPFLLST